jgi:predicted Fe-Mo cluster-binding NifX family protein
MFSDSLNAETHGKRARGKPARKEFPMKIAVVSDDGMTISAHFGRAQYYVVVNVEDNRIASLESREKMGHVQFGGETHAATTDPRGSGFDAGAQSRHARMLDAIGDCQVLIARGMGAGAYDSIRAAGIRPIVTDVLMITDAVRTYLEGKLVDHVERLH